MRLKSELQAAVKQLGAHRSFDIIFSHDETFDALAPALIPATPENRRRCDAYFEQMTFSGSNDPTAAITAAMKLKPQIVYFLATSADFPDDKAVRDAFRAQNADRKTRVNTILFVYNKEEQEAQKDSEPIMRAIAADNGGVFKWFRWDELGR